MKPRLLSRILMPHGGLFHIEDPLTKKPIEGTHFEMVYNRAVAYRKANSIPIGLDFEDELENAVCNAYPQECAVSKSALGVPSVAPGLYDVVRASAVMINHKVNDSELVSQEEANRRAQICRACPLRSQMTLPCSRCISALENVVGWITKSRGTPYDENLSACGVCRCFISASVWLPLSTQCLGVTDEQKEKFAFANQMFGCWKNCA
jgi:hypothetical protein